LDFGAAVCRVGTSAGAYKLDKNNKTFTLVTGLDDTADTRFWHFQHHFVWAKLGYTVLPEVDWNGVELNDNLQHHWIGECTDNPHTGEVYTCNDLNCPVHGKRNREILRLKD
jgi:hypothetical protein